MKIGFIGTGGMSHALATKWSAKHQLFFGGRSVDKASALARQFSAAAGTPDEALAFADVVVLGVPATDVINVVNGLGADAFKGKIVIDITNPVDLATFRSTLPEGSITGALAALLPGAHLGKAFNMAHTSVWEAPDLKIDGRSYVTLFTSDDAATSAIAMLIEDAGSEPLRIGDNAHAYQLEAAAAMVIKLLFSGRHGNTVLQLIQPEKKAVR